MTDFTVLEHKLPQRLGLSEKEIKLRRTKLKYGEDWVRQGRWIKYSQNGMTNLLRQTGLEESAVPAEKPDEWVLAEVRRCNFFNRRLISVSLANGDVKLVRINEQWHDLYRPRMKIQVIKNGEAILKTRRPKSKWVF